MKNTIAKLPYSLIEVPVFDARRGLARCSVKGIGARVKGHASPDSDFWRSPNGSVLVRVELGTVRRAFEVRLINGDPIPEDALEVFSWFVSEQLLQWTTDLDDEPFEEVSFPSMVIPPANTYWLARLLIAWLEYKEANRSPEIVFELLPELGGNKEVCRVAEEADLGYRFSLMFDVIRKAKNKFEAAAGTSTDNASKDDAASSVKRLNELELHLARFSVFGEPALKLLKKKVQTDRSYLWDNDPFAVPKDAARWRSINVMGFDYSYGKGISPAENESLRGTALNRAGYAVWWESKKAEENKSG